MKRIGFSVAELIYFDIGDILNIAKEYVGNGEDDNVRKATQADFDSF